MRVKAETELAISRIIPQTSCFRPALIYPVNGADLSGVRPRTSMENQGYKVGAAINSWLPFLSGRFMCVGGLRAGTPRLSLAHAHSPSSLRPDSCDSPVLARAMIRTALEPARPAGSSSSPAIFENAAIRALGEKPFA